jgi:predicted permease
MPDGLPLAVEGESPTLAYVLVVTPNYFEALGVPAAAGRVFAPGDEAGDVVVLSHAAWQRRFLGDPGVVGRTVRMGGRPFTVLGVAHRDFAGTAGLLAVDAFLPLGAYARVSPGTEQWLEARDARSLRAFARLRPGISLEQARAAVEPLSGQLDALRPEASRGVRIVVHPEAMTRLETAAPAYLPPIAALFLTLVALLVLVAAFNVTGLALSRMVERRRELAVRQALGASRGRLLRPLVAENVLLGLGGGLVGLALATWATTWLGDVRLASDVPLLIQLRPDARVFGLGLGLSALVGLGVGLGPGLLATRRDVATALRDRGAAAGRGRLRAALVVGQIAVSAALLVAGGLLLQSLGHFLRMDLGFRVERRALATLDVGLRGLDAERGEAFHRAVLERVRALPGVRRATQAALLPIGLSNSPGVVKAEGQADRPGQFAWTNAVESDYFETLGIPVLRGRGFADSDEAGMVPRAVVSESLASLLWPGLDPLGRRLVLEGGAEELEVVGVARDSTHNLPGEARRACLYLALRQTYRSERTLVAETAGAAESLLPRVREIVAGLDRDMPVYDLRTLQAHIDGGKAALLFRLGGALAGAFGVIGFVLAAIGLYGALAYAVGQRVPELALRLALGATAGRLRGMVVGEGLRLAALGLVVGLPLAAALAAALQDLIVGLGPRDPGTYLAVAAGLLIGCAGAALLPAWRASRVDPLVSLRAD